MIDTHPTVVAAVERHELIRSRLAALWAEVGDLALRLAELRQYRDGPDDSIEAEVERLLKHVSTPGRMVEREEAEARLSNLRRQIRALEFAEQKARNSIGVARRLATDDRFRSDEVVYVAKEIHAAAVALAAAVQRGQVFGERLKVEGVPTERLYWLSRAGWTADAVDAWRKNAESICGASLAEPS